MTILDLPAELFLGVILHSNIETLCDLSLCNKTYYDAVNDPYIWYKLMCRDYVKSKFIPDKNYKTTYKNIAHAIKTDNYDDMCGDLDIWKHMCEKFNFSTKTYLLHECQTFDQLCVLFEVLDEMYINVHKVAPDRLSVVYDENEFIKT